MKKFNFPGNYKNDSSLINVIRFISNFKMSLIKQISKEMNLIYLEIPQISFYEKNNNLRSINFDNKQNQKIYQLNTFHCDFLNKTMKSLIKEENINGVFTNFFQINRDALNDNNNPIEQNILDIRIEITKNDNENFLNLTNEHYQKIIDCFIKSIEEAKINKVNINYKLLTTKYFFKTLKKISKNNQLLKIDDYIKKFLEQYEYIFLFQKNNLMSDYINIISDYDDKNNSVQILFFNKEFNQIINIGYIALSKNKEKQYIHFYLKIDQIILLLLNKYHLSEIKASVWDSSLYKETKQKKVKIFNEI